MYLNMKAIQCIPFKNIFLNQQIYDNSKQQNVKTFELKPL